MVLALLKKLHTRTDVKDVLLTDSQKVVDLIKDPRWSNGNITSLTSIISMLLAERLLSKDEFIKFVFEFVTLYNFKHSSHMVSFITRWIPHWTSE